MFSSPILDVQKCWILENRSLVMVKDPDGNALLLVHRFTLVRRYFCDICLRSLMLLLRF